MQQLRLQGAMEQHADALATVAGLAHLPKLTALELQVRVDNARGVAVSVEQGQDLFAALWACSPGIEHLEVGWYANVGRRQVPQQLALALFAGPQLVSVHVSAILRYLRRTATDLQTLQDALHSNACIERLRVEGDAECRRNFGTGGGAETHASHRARVEVV